MAEMVSAEEQDALGNFDYACTAGDLIQVVHHTSLGTNLKLMFDELLCYLARCPPPMTPLPLLDSVELGCEFPPEIELVEKLELPTEDMASQQEDATTEQPIVDPATEHAPQANVID